MKKNITLLIFSFLLLSTAFLFSCGEECDHSNIYITTVEAGCDSEGYTLHKCRDCGYEYKTDISAPTGHTLHSVAHAPTCTDHGYTDYLCTVCGYSYTAGYLPPTGHVFSGETVAPTCTEEGYTKLTCSVCAEVYKDNYTAPTGHILDKTVHAPTCSEQGHTDYSCSVCDYSYSADYLPPLSHSFRTDIEYPSVYSTTGYTHYTCTECGYEYTGDFVFYTDIFKGAYVDGKEILARGIDVSKYNGIIDWEKMKAAGIDFAILKAGSTKSGMDPYFEINYKGAKAAGIDVGCYFYTYSSTVSGILADADTMLGWLEGRQFEYPIYLDMEDESIRSTDGGILTDMCLAFIDRLQKNGYFGALYTNNDWLINTLDKDRLTGLSDIWLARWRTAGDAVWQDSYGTRMGMWQYTDSGSLPDHSCAFDMNVAFKDYPALMKEWGYNGY